MSDTKRGEDLSKLLQNAYKGYAYELLALEIDVENGSYERDPSLIKSISKLIQLYMLGVQVLQGNSDERYKYFNKKIQGLMNKKHIIEELHLASTGKKADKQILKEVNKVQIEKRKNHYDIQMFLNNDQYDLKKIKQIMKVEEGKIKKMQEKVSSNLKQQEDKIQERIKLRKMKSETYSSRKLQFNSPEKSRILQDFGVENPSKKVRERKGSVQKLKNLKTDL